MTGAMTLVLQQQKQMLAEIAAFRDQLAVLTAICLRVETAVQALTIEKPER